MKQLQNVILLDFMNETQTYLNACIYMFHSEIFPLPVTPPV